MSKTTLVSILAGLLTAAFVIWFAGRDNNPGTDEGQAIVPVNIPKLSEIAQLGEQDFNANCAVCHGINAAGKQGMAPPLVHIIYEPSHHGDVSFVLAVKNGVRGHHWPFGNMPPIEGVSEKQMVQIIEYVRELQRANGIF